MLGFYVLWAVMAVTFATEMVMIIWMNGRIVPAGRIVVDIRLDWRNFIRHPWYLRHRFHEWFCVKIFCVECWPKHDRDDSLF